MTCGRRTASELAAAVRSGSLDPREVVAHAVARAHADPHGAFVLVDDKAPERAQRGEGPLQGVPVAVKDLYDVAGQVTRAGSAVPTGPPAVRDAPAVARLRAAGAVVVGRTRTHEFAWGITTQHATLGGTANPRDPSRVPGGSSGGSAAAVAAGVVPVALGTDTGASLRLPAAWCGVVAHKPTHGTVPLEGVVPLAPSLDTGGALVQDVADAALVHQVLTGTPLPPAHPRTLGVVAPLGCSAAVQRVLEETAARWPGRREDAVLPLDGARCTEVYLAEQAGEALAWHRGTGRWPRYAQHYGPDVRGHLERAAAVAEPEAGGARTDRARLRAGFATLFARVDLLLMPVAAGPPSRRSDPDSGEVDGLRLPLRRAVLPWTTPVNLAGLPACSLPCGLDEHGLPVGLQVVGPVGGDALVLAGAALLERLLRS